MTAAPQEKGPAKAATFPSRGSTNPRKDMDMNTHTCSTGLPVGATISHVVCAIDDTLNLLHAAWLAVGSFSDEAERAAIVTLIGTISERLDDARKIVNTIDGRSAS